MEAVKPWRVLLRGAFLPGWSDAPQSEKDEVFREYLQIHKDWAAELGVKFIASLDNEMLIVGPPSTREANFFELYEVPDPTVLKKMLDYYRYPKNGRMRLDKYFRFEAVIGNPIGSLERAMAG
jgi:hypothetical protein